MMTYSVHHINIPEILVENFLKKNSDESRGLMVTPARRSQINVWLKSDETDQAD